MNNLGITSEGIIDLTDTDIFLDAKQEENDCIFTIDDEDVEFVETEKNEFQTRGNFETIFLPEIYTGVAVETPFFDILSYKENFGHSTEDVNNSNVHINSNANEHSRHQEGTQIEKNVYNGYTPTVIKNNLEKIGDDQKEAYGNYSCKPHNKLIYNSNNNNQLDAYVPESIDELQEISNENGYNYQTPLNIIYKSSMNSTNQYDKVLTQSYMKREFNDVNPVESSLLRNRLQQNKRIQNKNECESPSSSNSTKHFTWSSNKRTLCDEAGKYKCPICKITKTFDTLLAVNNHLKFSHISFFSNRKDGLQESYLID